MVVSGVSPVCYFFFFTNRSRQPISSPFSGAGKCVKEPVINVNFNSPDKFFFNFLPVAVYLLSLIFLASRYYSITEAFQSSASASTRINGNNESRFLVTSGDNMLLREQGDGEWDTPYRAEIPSQSKADDDKAW